MPATFWLLTLIAAEMPRLSRKHVAALVSLGVMFSTVLENNIPSRTVVPIVVFSLVREVLALSVNLWAMFRSMPVTQELGDVVPAAAEDNKGSMPAALSASSCSLRTQHLPTSAATVPS